MTAVVIVDDQAINLKIVGRYARSLAPDVTVHGFLQPEKALAFVRELAPALIVTDFVMPDMDGAEFIRRCRQLEGGEDYPIIVVTAYEDKDFRYQALDAGASDYLLSPIDGREFCIRARNLLSLWEHRRALRERASHLEDELIAAERQRVRDIRQREEQLRRVIDTVPALIRSSDAHDRIVFLNSFHEMFFDIERDAIVGSSGKNCFAPEYDARHRTLDQIVRSTGQVVAGEEETVIDPHGRDHVLLTTKAPLLAADGAVDQVVTVSLDITKRKRSEQAVLESEQRFRNLVEGSVIGIVIEQDGRPIFANRTYARIFGYDDPDDILALTDIDRLLAPDVRRRVGRLRRSGAWSRSPAEPFEVQGIRRDSSIIWLEILSQPVTWQGAPALQSTVVDITLRKAYEERLQRQANFDDVTGLPNRVLAIDRLTKAVASAIRHAHKGSVLFIDLDQFKKINDTWGHATGDDLLREAAQRLLGCVRREDTVARLGGDEFTVILPNIDTASHTEPVIHKILGAFSQPFVLGRHEAFVTASIGIAVFPDDSDDPAALMRHADAAMYLAKDEGRNTFRFFTPALNERAMERMLIESHLVHAVDRGDLRLYYQPIIDARCRRLVGAEALLRWDNAQLGTLDPEIFIPLAEDTGLIVPVGRWVLDKACAQLRAWREMGYADLTLAVNVSSRQLRGNGIVDTVAEALARYAIPPEFLELEITEGCLLQDIAEIRDALQALDRLGVRLSLDDFGTGYSCLSHLKDLPVDTVKIDKSFILNVSGDPGNATVVEAIIAMAHRLGLRVIAEGVETADQLDFIRVRGCDFAQGFYFAPPLSTEDFQTWLETWCHRRPHALP